MQQRLLAGVRVETANGLGHEAQMLVILVARMCSVPANYLIFGRLRGYFGRGRSAGPPRPCPIRSSDSVDAPGRVNP